MEKNVRVLICDDSDYVHESLSAYLAAENMLHVSVYDGQAALDMLKNDIFDIVILDIMMPKRFGTDVCKEIRKTSDIPIIMLSARGDEFDRIQGLELGADDYITKPFSPREVVARIHTILKRLSPRKEAVQEETKLVIGHMAIYPLEFRVTIYEKELCLTPKEVAMLVYFAQHPNKVLSREQLLNKVWGYDYFGDTRAVDTLIKRLRQKMPQTDCGFEIKAIYGVGYKLEVSL